MNKKEIIEDIIAEIDRLYDLSDEEYSTEALMHADRATELLEKLLKEIY